MIKNAGTRHGVSFFLLMARHQWGIFTRRKASPAQQGNINNSTRHQLAIAALRWPAETYVIRFTETTTRVVFAQRFVVQ